MHLARKFLFVLFLPFCIAQSFAADQWPAGKPIRLIVPFPAGGGADTIIRTISDELSRNIGQKIIIENRPGAGGCLGTEYALKGKADGRTLLYVTNGTLGINPALYPKIGYDALNDIEPVARLTEISLIMAVNPQRHDVKSLKDFLSSARASATAWTYASAGNGTSSHLAGVMLSEISGINFRHIPYRGGAASMLDVLAGRVDFVIEVSPNILTHIQAGKLRALGRSSAAADKATQNIPAMSSSGLQGYELSAWDGIAVKKGTPVEIVQALNRAVEQTLQNPKVRNALIARGAMPVKANSEEFSKFIVSEHQKWRQLVKKSRTSLD